MNCVFYRRSPSSNHRFPRYMVCVFLLCFFPPPLLYRYHLVNSCDENFDRSVTWNEFMQFFLVVWIQRLTEMKRKLADAEHAEHAMGRGGGGGGGRGDDGRQPQLNQSASESRLARGKAKEMEDLRQMIKRAERTARMMFGPNFMAMAARQQECVVPGPFSTLLRQMDMGADALATSFVALSPKKSRGRGGIGGGLDKPRPKSASAARPKAVRQATSAGQNQLLRMRLGKDLAAKDRQLGQTRTSHTGVVRQLGTVASRYDPLSAFPADYMPSAGTFS